MKVLISLVICILLTLNLPAQKSNGDYATNSVLASGKWHAIKNSSEGVYKIDFNRLKELGFSDPSRVRIFANNTGQLSYYNSDPRPDDLVEVAIEFIKGSDAIFNEGDFLLFFAAGTHRWKYDKVTDNYKFHRHNYSDTAVYFVTDLPGETLLTEAIPSITGQSTYTTESFDLLYIKEDETSNLIESGREWYHPVSTISPIAINPGFNKLVPGEPLKYRIRVVGRSGVPSMFRLLSEGETLLSLMVPEVNMSSTTGTYARYAESEGSLPYKPSPTFEIRFYNNGDSRASGWFDYLWLHGRASLEVPPGGLVFSDARSAGTGVVNEYRIKSLSSAISVWDVTNHKRPAKIESAWDGTFITFKTTADSVRKFVAFKNTEVPPAQISPTPLANQNLHAISPCDMIIVTHPLFLEHARRLAEIHFENDGLLSEIVTVSQIYNEFSGGIQDISAIRNFVRMVRDKNLSSDHPLKYLLLFGDGSYQNKMLPPKNPNFIPTWQTQNSNVVTSSFMSDDFYGLLDEGEGESSGFLDIGIGRLPATDTTGASILVDKIDRYINGSDKGTWRNIVTFAGDDEDGNLHMADAENLALLVSTVNPALNIEKIYLDAFKQEVSANGQSYPDVNKAITDRIEKGTLIFNYLGHGNENGLAHERVVKTDDIISWKNSSRLPLFITATCEFSRYDDVDYNIITKNFDARASAGEMVLLNPDGGAIALMTTTRVVFSAPNYILNRNIYQYMFENDANGNPPRLGDIIRLAKINSGTGNNKRNFSLLGDPALRLAFPWNGVVMTDSLNNKHVSLPPDTIKALSEITLAGHISDFYGNTMDDFSGVIYTTVYDKPQETTTLANDGGFVMEFKQMNSVLFSGKTEVLNGHFSVKFIVPRDINYNYGNGKISYYANSSTLNVSGYTDNLIVGGFSNYVRNDTTGPIIELFLNDTLFKDGGLADSQPILMAIISDSSGINTTGAGIGHDISMWINDGSNLPTILNNYFEADFGSYTRGTIHYSVGVLEPGHNSITLKAWDNYNNSTQETLFFVVGDDIKFILNDILNYPNPFTETTRFSTGHNRPDEELYIEIGIYDMSGRKIKLIRETSPPGSYMIQPVEWDRTSENGSRVSRGVYIYRITVMTGDNEIAHGSGRMIIL